MDHYGYQNVLGYLRVIFRGQELPLDAKPDDILFYVNEFLASKEGANVMWRPTRVQFTGKGSPAEDYIQRRDRITVNFGVIQDGRRVIEDITLG